MIHIEINKCPDGRITSFTMDGHANFADKGQDIVCAGASAVAFGSVNAIIALLGIEPEINQAESGFLQCSFSNDFSEDKAKQLQLLLNSMVVSLQTIERDYSDFINISFKE